MLRHREKWMKYMVMGVEVEPEQSLNYGCLGINEKTNEIVHYVEKPSSFVSRHINAGVYLLSVEVFEDIATIFKSRYAAELTTNDDASPSISLEHDILPKMAGTGKFFAFMTDRFWMSIKSAGSAIYANRVMLDLYNKYHPNRLAPQGDNLTGNVYIHPTAKVDPSAKLGPHVAIGANVVIHEGARVKNSIVLDGAVIKQHACLLNTIVGWGSQVGSWTRVEGSPTELDPNRPHATTDNFYLFDTEGKLLPTITILGRDVTVPDEVIIRNSIVLPGKDLTWGLNNQILL
jgi:mannose-1-phosphate guanylyltransferase